MEDDAKKELALIHENYNLIKFLPDSLCNQLNSYEKAFKDDAAEIDGSDDNFRDEATIFREESYKFVEIVSKLKTNLQTLIDSIPDQSYFDLKDINRNFDYFIADVASASAAEKLREISEERMMVIESE